MNNPFFKKGQVIKTEYPFYIAVRKGQPVEGENYDSMFNDWRVGFLKEYEGCGTGGDWSQYYYYDAMGEQEIVILSIAKMPKRYKDRIIFSVRYKWPDEAKDDYWSGWTTKRICVATEHKLKKRLPQFNFGVGEYDKR